MDAAAGAAAGDSAIEALGFEMKRSRTLVRFAREKPALAPVRLTEVGCRAAPFLRFAQDTAQPGGFEGVGTRQPLPAVGEWQPHRPAGLASRPIWQSFQHGRTRSTPLHDPIGRESPELGQVSARRTLLGLLLGGLTVLIAVGVAQLPGGSSPGRNATTRLTATQTRALLAGSPPVLASLHAQGGMLLEGGASALHARLAALKGYPVVINKWASWCVPCKEESGAFQRVSAEYGRRVAFIGIDSEDPHHSEAAAFLKSFPVSYPSYYDESGSLGLQLTDSTFRPATVFIPAHGSAYIREGEYPSAAKLERDVQRYALDG